MSVTSCPLLRLPHSLRYRIYLAAGVVHDRVIELDTLRYAGCMKYHEGVLDLRQTCNLLYTCRAIHDEVLFILYSENSFSLHYCRSGFKSLLRLGPQALSSMTRLEISLRRVIRRSCRHESFEGYGSHIYHFLKFHKEPLQRGEEQIIDDWSSAAKHLFSRILPNRLNFGLICDTDEFDMDVAHRIVRPFLICPPLKECSIRLSAGSHIPLAGLAKRTALMATRVQQSSFPRVNLPDEILLCILRYTGLLHLPSRLLEISDRQCTNSLKLGRYFPRSDEFSTLR